MSKESQYSQEDLREIPEDTVAVKVYRSSGPLLSYSDLKPSRLLREEAFSNDHKALQQEDHSATKTPQQQARQRPLLQQLEGTPTRKRQSKTGLTQIDPMVWFGLDYSVDCLRFSPPWLKFDLTVCKPVRSHIVRSTVYRHC
jgi:hypothetical protein